MEGGQCFADSSELGNRVNGVLIPNPTLKQDGDYQLINWGSRWDTIKNVIGQAKVQTSRRYLFARCNINF